MLVNNLKATLHINMPHSSCNLPKDDNVEKMKPLWHSVFKGFWLWIQSNFGSVASCLELYQTSRVFQEHFWGWCFHKVFALFAVLSCIKVCVKSLWLAIANVAALFLYNIWACANWLDAVISNHLVDSSRDFWCTFTLVISIPVYPQEVF